MIDHSGLDTQLARLLHAQGRLDIAVLRDALSRTRAGRGQTGATLARTLVLGGVLSEEEAIACLARLQAGAGPPPRPTARLASSLADSAAPVAIHAGDTVQGNVVPVSVEREPSAWRPGARVGDYRVLEQLGAGGMGVVFLAEHVRTGARYALKTLPDDAPQELLDRLRREGEALASVDAHPNVVRIHTLGQAYGRLYLVMELATGGTLEARLRQGPLDPLDAARVVRDLARGLEAMHAKGILHRDLKPANVIFGEGGTPKLVDFGLAHMAGASRMTMTGELIGTPAFMAPEQALVDREKIGPKTDVYGLGCVLYFALTGSPPFDSRTMVEVLTKVVWETPPPASSRRKGIPAELDALCARTFAKDPENRPSAAELARELDAFIGRSTVRSGGRRSPLVAVVGVGALLAVLAVLAGAVAARWPRSRPAEVAPVASTSFPVAPPTPRPVKPREKASLTWQLAAGQTFRAFVDVKFSFENKGMFSVTGSHRLELACRVDTASTTSAAIEARLERLAVDYSVKSDGDFQLPADRVGQFQPMSFDSAHPPDPPNPLAQAVGKTFKFRLDPRTGKVSKVHGAAAIQEAVFDAAPEGPARERYALFEFSTEEAFRQTANGVLNLVPAEGALPGWPWTIDRPMGAALAASGLELGITASVESSESENGEVHVTWSGSAGKLPGRSLQGSAVFGPRGLVRSQQTESMRTAPMNFTSTIDWSMR